ASSVNYKQNFKSYSHEKKECSVIDTACTKIAGFSELYQNLKQKVSLSGKSDSTLRNYSHHLAKMALHFDCLPTALDIDQINDYLYLLQQQHDTPSDSYFKHTVYGLRFAFRLSGLNEKRIQLPSSKKDKKLPVVLSREEVKLLLTAPKLLKHRILIALLYGCGLRCFEVRNIKLSDLDFNRKMLHVRQGKNKKDRYV